MNPHLLLPFSHSFTHSLTHSLPHSHIQLSTYTNTNTHLITEPWPVILLSSYFQGHLTLWHIIISPSWLQHMLCLTSQHRWRICTAWFIILHEYLLFFIENISSWFFLFVFPTLECHINVLVLSSSIICSHSTEIWQTYIWYCLC